MSRRAFVGGRVRASPFDGAGEIRVADGRIEAIGDDLGGARGADVVDLDGGFVLPGFIETHMHPLWYGANLRHVRVTTPPCRTIEDVVAALAARARDTPPGEVIRAWGYDDTAIADERGLTAADLDRASVRHPILVHHLSYHALYASSLALSIAGVGAETPEPVGGTITRREDGTPTGELRERPAERLVLDRFPEGPEIWHEAVPRVMAELAAVGVTTVHDLWVHVPEVWEAYRAAHAAGELAVRVRAYAAAEVLDTLGLEPNAGDDRLRLGGMKIISDGSIQLHTACLCKPYFDRPAERGAMILPPAELGELVERAHRRGHQLAIHAIGDCAIDAALDAVAEALRAVPRAGHRHRLEHTTTLRDDQIARLVALGMGASLFVNHVFYWGDRHRERFLGPERAERIAPIRSVAAAGLPFALHCDCPVTPVDPLFTMSVAVERKTRGGHLLGERERVDFATALGGYTTGAAWLGFDEDRKGVLAPGRYADFVVLDRDPFAVEPAAIREARVRMTVVGGEIVHRA